MNHTVTEGRGGDQTLFGFMDVKTVIPARLINLFHQFFLQFKQVIGQQHFKCSGCSSPAFAARSIRVGKPQILPTTELFLKLHSPPIFITDSEIQSAENQSSDLTSDILIFMI